MRQPIRKARDQEVFELECYSCGRLVELQYTAATYNEVLCVCGAELTIEWRPPGAA